jgi:assimilatory nitrate reductase catalytic subunit
MTYELIEKLSGIQWPYNKQINKITIADFDPKSFEPNYKQCAVQLHSIKVAKELEHIVVSEVLRKDEVKA